MIKILIVDDSLFMRKWLKAILQKEGYTNFIEASNGKEAIEKYAFFKPDIVFLDITMTQMDGLAALRKIMELDPTAKVIMCSALGTQSNVIEARKSGAKGFLIKPYFNEVASILERVLTMG